MLLQALVAAANAETLIIIIINNNLGFAFQFKLPVNTF